MVGIPLGLVTAVVGCWAVAVSASSIGEAANTLAEPQYPAGPRLLLLAVVMATCAIAIWSRPAGVAMAATAAALVGYSWMVFVELAPTVLSPTVAPADVIQGGMRAIVTGGANGPLLLAAGGWMGIALWWLSGRGGRPAGAGGMVIGFVLGLGVGVVAWWALPVVARAMLIMFSQGRESFSILPSVVVIGLAAASAWAIMRWPAVALGAAVAAIGSVVVSLVVDDPASGVIALAGNTDWWSVQLVDLEESIRSAAFRPGALVLAAAWTVMAVAHLLAMRSDPVSRAVPQPSPAD